MLSEQISANILGIFNWGKSIVTVPQSLTSFIWHFIKEQKVAFIVIQVLALAWSLDNTLWPYAFKLLIDKIMIFNADKSQIWYYLMPVLIFWGSLWLTIEVMFRVMGFMMAAAFPRLEASIRMVMFQYVEDHSYDFFASNFAGNISNKISDMTQSVTRIMQLVINLFVPAFVALVIASGIFFTVNAFFALLLVGWAILHIGICLLGAKKCASLSKAHSSSRSFLTGKIVDAFSNVINIKIFSRQQYEFDYINRYQKDEQTKNRAALIAVEKIKVALAISSFIFPCVLMTWYLIYSWQYDLISIGDVVLILYTTWNITIIAWMAGLELPNLFKEIGICQQALSIIKAKHDITDRENATTLRVKKGEITFDKVSFNYLKDSRIFENISLAIKAGEKIGLVGFSGSGKSTFVNLIMRFFDIAAGRILIDGTDISTVTLDSLRRQISMIPQDPSLFHRTLMDNIRYGKINATDQEVFAAARHAHCHDFIMELPQGYDSLAGERGIKLSGGQRQRIAIARAILENSPILILDEATSALDSVTEKHIQAALHYLTTGRTTIVIAHRLSTLAEMDRILVFDNGQIIEEGSHKALLAQAGHYAKMWHMQAGGFLPDSPKVIA